MAHRARWNPANAYLLVQRLARRLLVISILAWPFLATALPPATDLAADAVRMREQRVPLLVLFSRDGCVWCERARQQFLDPMAADPANASRMLIRQINIDRRTATADFSGQPTTHADFARGHKITLTPTLLLLGPDGSELAEPIVGVRLPEYYGTYIERAVDAGLARLRKETP